MVCPKCKANRAHRSHRRGLLERVSGLCALYPYRCHVCEHRFLRVRDAESPVQAGKSAAEREVRATRNAHRWRRKRRQLLLYGTCAVLFLAFLYYITRQREASSEGDGAAGSSVGARRRLDADRFQIYISKKTASGSLLRLRTQKRNTAVNLM